MQKLFITRLRLERQWFLHTKGSGPQSKEGWQSHELKKKQKTERDEKVTFTLWSELIRNLWIQGFHLFNPFEPNTFTDDQKSMIEKVPKIRPQVSATSHVGEEDALITWDPKRTLLHKSKAIHQGKAKTAHYPGVGQLVDGKMDGAKYKAVLEENLITVAKVRLGWRFNFQRDNTYHTVSATKEWFGLKNISCVRMAQLKSGPKYIR